MERKGTSVFSNGLIWFGAGVSLAEILTGTYFAPLGFGKAMAAILLGHLIGGLMMFAAGMIGAKERKSAMETVKMSFGERGSLLFAVLNVLQLVGWTAIMIYDGHLRQTGFWHTGNLGMGDHYRRTDCCLDFCRTYESWQVKYGCHDRTFYFISGSF